MNKLSYQTLKEKEFTGYLLKEAPERVIQFGEGNFMRAFVDFFIDNMNEKADFNSKVVLVQPIAPIPGAFDLKDAINEQEGLYTLYLRGCENGEKVNKKRIISCVSRCLNAYTDFDAVMACAENPQLRFISCNTTEAGITYDPACRFEDRPASSYPGKLTQFLYRRFRTFGSQPGKGFLILACELIDDNGKELEKCVLKYASQWNLGEDFILWLQKENTFCSTLVDRIVTGFPRAEAAALNKENGYEDNVMDTGEIFGFWVIEGPQSIRTELPFEKAGLPILVTDDHKPYKQRKVRILNGAHTSMVLGAYLAGQDIVRGCMEDRSRDKYLGFAINLSRYFPKENNMQISCIYQQNQVAKISEINILEKDEILNIKTKGVSGIDREQRIISVVQLKTLDMMLVLARDSKDSLSVWKQPDLLLILILIPTLSFFFLLILLRNLNRAILYPVGYIIQRVHEMAQKDEKEYPLQPVRNVQIDLCQINNK